MITITKQYEVKFASGRKVTIYSEHDLSTIDIEMRSAVSVRATGLAGTGSDGKPTYDGVPAPTIAYSGDIEPIGKHHTLADVDRILKSRKRGNNSVDRPKQSA